MTAACFAFRPAWRRRARIELYGLIQARASPGEKREGNGGKRDDTPRVYRVYANRPGASRLSSRPRESPEPAWPGFGVKERDALRPTSTDKLSAPLYKAQRRASGAPLPVSENGTLLQWRSSCGSERARARAPVLTQRKNSKSWPISPRIVYL